MRHLLHPELPFGSFSEELTDLAEVVMAAALTLAQQTLQERYGMPQQPDGSPCTFALFGLGKFGGRELGYASDIEMLCVYSGQGTTSGGAEQIAVSEYAELLVQQCRDNIVARRAGIFEIDLRLRPHGSHGPLATSVDTFQHYYSQGGQAAPFERQALIKLRWVAGDATLGQQITACRDAFVYSAAPFDLAAAVQLRQRQIRELVRPGSTDTKYGARGIDRCRIYRAVFAALARCRHSNRAHAEYVSGNTRVARGRAYSASRIPAAQRGLHLPPPPHRCTAYRAWACA